MLTGNYDSTSLLQFRRVSVSMIGRPRGSSLILPAPGPPGRRRPSRVSLPSLFGNPPRSLPPRVSPSSDRKRRPRARSTPIWPHRIRAGDGPRCPRSFHHPVVTIPCRMRSDALPPSFEESVIPGVPPGGAPPRGRCVHRTEEVAIPSLHATIRLEGPCERRCA